MMKLRYMVLVAVLTLAVSGVQCAGLLNGGFESPTLTQQQVQLIPGGGDLPGWDLWSGNVRLYRDGPGWTALEGSQSVLVLDGPSFEFEQVIPTSPGVQYELSFLLAAPFGIPYAVMNYELVGIDHIRTATVVTSARADAPTLFQASFTANSTLTSLLLFTVDEPDGRKQGMALLDGVSVTAATVPEPTLWPFASLLAVLGGMILLKRR